MNRWENEDSSEILIPLGILTENLVFIHENFSTKSVEIPCICEECWGFTAQHNVIVKDNKIVENGDIIQLNKDLYRSICNDCYCRLKGE